MVFTDHYISSLIRLGKYYYFEDNLLGEGS